MQREITFETKLGEVVDLTEKIEKIVDESGVSCGIVNVFLPHATGVLIVGEYEPNIVEDYIKLMREIAPRGRGWAHDRIDDNAHAHLRSILFGTSVCIPVRNGKLALGTWQRIMFVENDGSRIRRAIITVISC